MSQAKRRLLPINSCWDKCIHRRPWRRCIESDPAGNTYEEGEKCDLTGLEIDEIWLPPDTEHDYPHRIPFPETCPLVKETKMVPECPECKALGQVPEKIHEDGSFSTAMGGTEVFWDSEKRRHVHNRNTITDSFSCSNGHRWVVKYKKPCPICGDKK